MIKSILKQYLSGEQKISHVSMRGTSWKARKKFPVISAEYNAEFGLIRVKFLTKSYGIREEILSSSNVTFSVEENAPVVELGTFEEVTFWFLLTDCCGQYGAGVDNVVLKTTEEKLEWERVHHQTLTYDFCDASRRDGIHAYN